LLLSPARVSQSGSPPLYTCVAPHPPLTGTAALAGERSTDGDGEGLGCEAAVDDSHATIASHAQTAMKRVMFLLMYTAVGTGFPR